MNGSRANCDQHLSTLIQLIHHGCNTVFVGVKPYGFKDNLLICCINRKGKILTPRGQNAIRVGDTVIVVTTNRGLNDIRDILKE